MKDYSGLKVALVHDWLVGKGGGERVLYDLHTMFPKAPIYTLVYDNAKAPEWCLDCDIRTTYIQNWPGAKAHHKLLLSFMPKAWEALDFSEYDLVISSCSSCCKGIVTGPDTIHICYCHSPIRYVWDLYHDYLRDASVFKRPFMRRIIHKIREWDYEAAQRPDIFISNSDFVGRRIAKFYRRDSVTVHPASSLIGASIAKPDDYYLVVSRFVGYKRIDIAIEACNKLSRHLVVVGSGGEDEGRLRGMAGPTIEFKGEISDSEILEYYTHAKAFLFPGLEDFGLTPVEAMSAGCPILAYGQGGALETVIDGKTGLFFESQTVDSLVSCIERFEERGVSYTRQEISKYARLFSREKFKEELLSLIDRSMRIPKTASIKM